MLLSGAVPEIQLKQPLATPPAVALAAKPPAAFTGARLESALTTLAFVATIVIFFGMSVRNWFGDSSLVAVQEHRSMSAAPRLNLNYESFRQFPTSFEAFYNDRIAWRSQLIAALSLLRYHTFQTTTANQVFIGKDDYLFLQAVGGEKIARNSPLFEQRYLDWWVNALSYRQAWLAARGIKYIVYVVPAASTIYPEKLPDGLRAPGGSSRLDQLMTALKKTAVKIVDLRPALREAKKQDMLYLKTGTHWNSRGAYVGTTAVVSALRAWFPEMPRATPSQLHLVPFNFGDGDLAALIGLHELLPEKTWREDPLAKEKWRLADSSKNYDLRYECIYQKPYTTIIDDQTAPSAVCLRDSYMVAQRDYLSNHFRRITYYWTSGFPATAIEREKPDVVIQEIAERFLAMDDYLPKSNAN